MAKSPTSAKPPETEPGTTGEADAAAAPKKRSKLLLFGIPAAVLLLIGGGLWFSGIIPHLLHGHKQVVATGPVFIKIPEIVANLNVPSGQDSYAKLEATLELSSKASVSQVQHDMPRIIDVFQTYLRARQTHSQLALGHRIHLVQDRLDLRLIALRIVEQRKIDV